MYWAGILLFKAIRVFYYWSNLATFIVLGYISKVAFPWAKGRVLVCFGIILFKIKFISVLPKVGNISQFLFMINQITCRCILLIEIFRCSCGVIILKYIYFCQIRNISVNCLIDLINQMISQKILNCQQTVTLIWIKNGHDIFVHI